MIIEVENISKIYKKKWQEIYALKNVTFKVENNQILGILGPNGAGKTTLLKILTGITTPDNNIKTLKLLDSGDIKAVKHRIGFLPENPEFIKNISAYELLKFSLRISGNDYNKDRIDELLKNVNLYHERNEKVRNFSKGMMQRIGIAQAIVHSPELLILDEPMSGLDPPGRRMVIDIIDTYFKEGKTILFSTHNLDDIEALCTDVLVLNKGQIRLERSLSSLRENCNYKIQVEIGTKKRMYDVEGDKQFWGVLDEIRIKEQKILKIQSGISRDLEKYYDQ